eukprot:804389-Prymnesium_polylepis.1
MGVMFALGSIARIAGPFWAVVRPPPPDSQPPALNRTTGASRSTCTARSRAEKPLRPTVHARARAFVRSTATRWARSPSLASPRSASSSPSSSCSACGARSRRRTKPSAASAARLPSRCRRTSRPSRRPTRRRSRCAARSRRSTSLEDRCKGGAIGSCDPTDV